MLVQGSDRHLEKLRTLLSDGDHSAVDKLAREIDSRGTPQTEATVYVVVIGVYTDIKVQTLLVGLRTRYDLPNLGVSDTFTASATLERHLAGLDYAVRVLDVEVIHGVNDLVRFLGLPPTLEDESPVVARMSYARYQSFFQDKQNVLAFQDEKLRQYVALTERRSLEVYERIKRANTFLIWFGCTFLGATLVFAVLNELCPTGSGGGRSSRSPAVLGCSSSSRRSSRAGPRPPAESDEPGGLQDDFGESFAEDGPGAIPPDDAAHAARPPDGDGEGRGSCPDRCAETAGPCHPGVRQR